MGARHVLEKNFSRIVGWFGFFLSFFLAQQVAESGKGSRSRAVSPWVCCVVYGAGEVWVSSPSASSIPAALSVVWDVGQGSLHSLWAQSLSVGWACVCVSVCWEPASGRKDLGPAALPEGFALHYLGHLPQVASHALGLSFPVFIFLARWGLGAVPGQGQAEEVSAGSGHPSRWLWACSLEALCTGADPGECKVLGSLPAHS